MLYVVCCFVGQGLCSFYSEERKLGQLFNLSSHITLEPNSYSRRILNDQVLLFTINCLGLQDRPLHMHLSHNITITKG